MERPTASARPLALALALLATPVLLTACSQPGPAETDGGLPDGGEADGGRPGTPTGEACPQGDPGACEGGVCLYGAGGVTWCSEWCVPGACPEGFPCQTYPFGDDADLRDVCAPACVADAECASEDCDEATGLCASPPDGTRQVGEACGGADGTCRGGLFCLTAPVGDRCMAGCDRAADPFCESGAFCWPSPVPGGGICWLGGGTAAGASCGSHAECPLGHLCVEAEGGRLCRAGCDPDDGDPGCAEGTCQPLPDRDYGFCAG